MCLRGVVYNNQIIFNEVTHSGSALIARDESSAAGVHSRQVLCVPARHTQTVVARGFFPRVMRSSIARFAVRACGRSSFGRVVMANNGQLNSSVDLYTAIGLTEQRLQSMLEAAAKSAAARAVAALTSRGGGTASLTGSAAAGESTLALSLPSYKRFPCVLAVHWSALRLDQTLACFRQWHS